MIDIHNHIIPNLDDGAKDLNESLEMARIAVADGIQTIVATPHNRDVRDRHSLSIAMEHKNSLERSIKEESLPLKIVFGMENHLETDLIEQLIIGHALPIEETKYILLELPFDFYPYYTIKVIKEIQSMGFIPIIAHPERNTNIQNDIQVFEDIYKTGALMQITAESLEGYFGQKSYSSARLFLINGFVHFIGSDGHSSSGHRLPELSKGVVQAERLIGSDKARKLVVDNPKAMLLNHDIN